MGNNTWAVLTNKNGIKVDFASILNKKEAINILNQYLDKNYTRLFKNQTNKISSLYI